MYSANLGAFRLTWERHTEFSTYTFVAEGTFEIPFKNPAISAVPNDWLAKLPGQVVAALHIAAEISETQDLRAQNLSGFFDNNRLVGGVLADGKARLWTDFKLHGDQFSRFLVHGFDLRATMLGRMSQRLAGMETYRMLALPCARDARPLVARAETTLTGILQSLAGQDATSNERALLRQLTDLAAGRRTHFWHFDI